MYDDRMEGWGFRRGKGCRVMFLNRERRVIVVVHGDDFVCVGTEKGLGWFKKVLGDEYPIKQRGRLGTGPKDDRVVRILNRAVEIREEGIAIEADQRHVEIAAQIMGITGSGGITSPGVKERGDHEEFGGNRWIRNGRRYTGRWRLG